MSTLTMNQLYKQSGSSKPFKEWVDEWKNFNDSSKVSNVGLNDYIQEAITDSTKVLQPQSGNNKEKSNFLGISYPIWFVGVAIIGVAVYLKASKK